MRDCLFYEMKYLLRFRIALPQTKLYLCYYINCRSTFNKEWLSFYGVFGSTAISNFGKTNMSFVFMLNVHDTSRMNGWQRILLYAIHLWSKFRNKWEKILNMLSNHKLNTWFKLHQFRLCGRNNNWVGWSVISMFPFHLYEIVLALEFVYAMKMVLLCLHKLWVSLQSIMLMWVKLLVCLMCFNG